MTSRILTIILSVALAPLIAAPTFAQDGVSSTVTRRTVIQSTSNTKTDAGSTTNSSGSSSDGTQSSNNESSEVVEQSGVMGFRKSNKFVPKYKERIETYKGQIALGQKAGWLSADDAEKFTRELGRLTELEAAVCAKNYVKPDIDDLDKQFTKFNMEFSNAGQKKPAPASTSSAATPPSAVSTTAASKPQVKTATQSKSTKAAPPAKGAAKAAPKTK